MGRKGKYGYWMTDDGLTLLRGWARSGLSDEQIAHNCDITVTTYYEWKKRFPEFAEAIKKEKRVVDYEVENTLLKRATGYQYKEITRERDINPETGKLELVVTKVVEKVMPPDTTALIFWLKNRQPEEWRDRRETAISGEISNPYAALSTEELKKLARDG